MSTFDHRKYHPFPPIAKAHRRWPDRVIEHAPAWASVDLRDGNQALVRPMDAEQKLKFFDLLVRLHGQGHGVVEALMDALARGRGVRAEVEQFDQHALTAGTEAKAIACVRVRLGEATATAVAFGEDTAEATLQAVLSAVGKALDIDAAAHFLGDRQMAALADL